MRRTCAGIVVQFDGRIFARKEDVEKEYKKKTGKDFDAKLDRIGWSEELQAYVYPINDTKYETFFDLNDLMIALSINGDADFNRWFFDAFMRELFYKFEAASALRFAMQMVDIAKEEE